MIIFNGRRRRRPVSLHTLKKRLWKTAYDWAIKDLKAKPAVARDIADAGIADL